MHLPVAGPRGRHLGSDRRITRHIGFFDGRVMGESVAREGDPSTVAVVLGSKRGLVISYHYTPLDQRRKPPN